MAQKSFPWSTPIDPPSVGDGTAGGYTAEEWTDIWRDLFNADNPQSACVVRGAGGQLAVSGAASPLSVADGRAVVYGKFFKSTAVEQLAVVTPSVGVTGGHVVLRVVWADREVRLALVRNTDGVTAIPTPEQNAGVVWEVRLATFTINTGGTISLADARVFNPGGFLIPTTGMSDKAVTNAKLRDSAAVSIIGRAANSAGSPADIAAGADDRLLARIANALAFVQLTTGMVPNNLLAFSKLAQLGGNAVLGRQGGATGDMHAISAGTNDRLFARVGDVLAFYQLTAGMIPADLIDDTKAGDRVPQFYRRQGGDATHFDSPGGSNFTPAAIRVQWGARSVFAASDTVTFPIAFSARPLVLLGNQTSGVIVNYHSIVATGFQAAGVTHTGAATSAMAYSWLAIGPE